MRQQPLSSLREQLKALIGDSLEVGSANDKTYNIRLFKTVKWLAGEYDWPFMELRTDVAATAGTRYYQFPLGADGVSPVYNYDRPIKAEYKWNTYWHKLDVGIGATQYNAFDSDRGLTADPPTRWRQTNDGRYELWPIPQTVGTVRLTGQQALTRLDEDDDLCDLDDDMVTLFTAAEIIQRSNLADSKSMMQQAQDRFLKLRQTSIQQSDPLVLGRLDSEAVLSRRNVPIVVVH